MTNIRMQHVCFFALSLLAARAGAQSNQSPSAAPQLVAAGVPQGAATPPAPGELWIAELPPVKTVRARIRGKDARDTAARQDAAFQVLKNYLAARAGFHPEAGPTPNVESEYRAYSSAQKLSAGGDLTPEAAVYVDRGTSFELEVLSALIPRDSVSQYQTTEPFRRALAEEARVAQLKAAALRVDAAKQSARADLNMFGIVLLDPLQVPDCPKDARVPADLMGIGHGGEQTCRRIIPKNAPPGFLRAILALVSSAQASREWVPVLLADSICPAWMKSGGTCTVMVAIDSGVAAGVLVPTGRDAQTIEAFLAGKYHQPAKDGDSVQCGNTTTREVTSHTSERVWNPPGLSISFEPISRDCAHGRILIDTNLLRNAPAGSAHP